MRVPDSALNEVRERGFSLVEGFLSPPELREAQEALWLHFPRPEDYFADAEGSSRFGASQFAGVEEFPYRSWDLNGLAVHPDLVDMAERYLETTELHLYKVELWAKYRARWTTTNPCTATTAATVSWCHAERRGTSRSRRSCTSPT